jgi:predicted nucleic acid-binding protein
LFNICGEELAIKAANNCRALRKKGVTIRRTVDVIIGTFCIENELQLLHNDKDFFPLEKHLGLESAILKSS